jgi:hypothetical protein
MTIIFCVGAVCVFALVTYLSLRYYRRLKRRAIIRRRMWA